MAYVTGSKGAFILKGYVGDNKTLLAFNFNDSSKAKNLAGFSIHCKPPGKAGYYLWNELKFADPSTHAQVDSEPPQSTMNAPIQKYRWVHVTGVNHQGLSPATGNYVYTVTPRYFDANHSMQLLDTSLSASITVPVGPFAKGSVSVGFTRGYMQSEAYASHFGVKTPVQPPKRQLQFDTSAIAGTNDKGEKITFREIYNWMGSTGHEQVFRMLNTVTADKSLSLRVFAYDLDEPDLVGMLLKLAADGRLRIILDSSKSHITHTEKQKDGTEKTVTAFEDLFAEAFQKQAKEPSAILRGCFGRYSHDKIFIVSKNDKPVQVLTGSTNFSVNGLYVNANHVLVFDDSNVASEYADVFEESWTVLQGHPKTSKAVAGVFAESKFATKTFQSGKVPKMSVHFSPHTESDTTSILKGICDRADKEAKTKKGNVIFAVMQLSSTTPNMVYDKLSQLPDDDGLYSYGISDAPQGLSLYQGGSKKGVLVTGRPGHVTLPPPFDEVPTPPGHEIHDKFVICGLNGKDPVVYCGSSNLAEGGEQLNGDNLLEIHDADVATAFAIEALLLVDHYSFLDRYRKVKATSKTSAVAKKTTVNSKKASAKATKAGRG